MTELGPPGPEDHERARLYHDVAPPKAATRPRVDPWTVILGILGGVLLGTGVTLAVLGYIGVLEEPPPPTNPPPPTLTLPPPTVPPTVTVETGAVTEVAQRAIPSIVAVQVSGVLGQGGGSGVVYSNDGYILTNHHVVEAGDQLVVVFADGGRWPAELVGTDPLTDLAVLRIARPDLTPIDLGSAADLQIGERAIAVGNPLALEGGPSVTQGIVSALDRSLIVDGGTQLFGLVQTDAPITRGSSGGALLDASARLIGITTAIAVSDVGAEGLGFAIPIDMAVGVANDLIEHGEVEHAFLGIRGDTVYVEEDGAQYPVGVVVDDLLAGSSFGAAGGQINDVLTAIEGERITTIEGLLTELRTRRAGDVVTISVNRGASTLEVEVNLGRLEP